MPNVWSLTFIVVCHRPDDGSLSWNQQPNYILQVYVMVVTILLISVKYTFTHTYQRGCLILKKYIVICIWVLILGIRVSSCWCLSVYRQCNLMMHGSIRIIPPTSYSFKNTDSLMSKICFPSRVNIKQEVYSTWVSWNGFWLVNTDNLLVLMSKHSTKFIIEITVTEICLIVHYFSFFISYCT